MTLPKVSIITPSYNKQQFIGDTINSVIKQTYQNWELLIVDDNSTDGTINIVKQFSERDTRIKFFINSENKGGNFCRNFGLKNAQGSYIVFLDADDILKQDCLLNRVKEMELNEKLDFCVFTMGNFNSEIGDNPHLWRPFSNNPLRDFLQHNLPWTIMQPIWKKEILLKVNGFDESFPRFQDVELHTRILFQKNISFKQVVAIPDCYYRIGEDRRNYNVFNYNRLRVLSCGLYFKKFYKQAVEYKLSNKLIGPVYETYLQIITHTRQKKMTNVEFQILEKELLDSSIITTYTFYKCFLFKLSKFYNFYIPRIPGVNKIINKLVLL